MAWGGLLLSLVLVFLAMGILLLSRRWQKASGLPEGSVIYSDGSTWFQNSEVLYDTALRLAGKPDYLVAQEDGSIVPVEIKSGPAPQFPWPGHVMQLMAYCRLVETAYGRRPAHGILQYSDRAFSVAYTAVLENDLLETVTEMGKDRRSQDLRRDHNDPGRCVSCGFRDQCADRLG